MVSPVGGVNINLFYNLFHNIWQTGTGGQRIGLFGVVWILLWFPIALSTAYFVRWRPFRPLQISQKLALLASLYWLGPGLIWLIANSQGGSLADYGLVWGGALLRAIAIGLAIALGGIGLLYLSQWQWLIWPPSPPTLTRTLGEKLLNWLLLPALMGLWIGGTEELIFRGFILTEWSQDFGRVTAAIVTSLLFALSHLLWTPRATLPQLPGLWLMGMVLAVACWLTDGSIGLAWGLHAGWVWGLTSLDTAQIIHYRETAPAWLIGYDRQPLAGAIGLLLLFATLGVLGVSQAYL
ncbi:CPBP family intramembrane metalloprotease [Trichothermofontia sichuanensis B231]|uniref:CPBP family intramembrane glutamic endopeptidase n=1 Tax=Trichothermofontia sichuanensis TaxID=3045816 RepID=UPI0022480F16|nr:type II CAAX endopeptidase family protein [Trichothermofontia sichuanensis]UZQ55682.1 CPBP family intramembrane metalloprotease [Trichothermofontia sichuanensis B231]